MTVPLSTVSPQTHILRGINTRFQAIPQSVGCSGHTCMLTWCPSRCPGPEHSVSALAVWQAAKRRLQIHWRRHRGSGRWGCPLWLGASSVTGAGRFGSALPRCPRARGAPSHRAWSLLSDRVTGSTSSSDPRASSTWHRNFDLSAGSSLGVSGRTSPGITAVTVSPENKAKLPLPLRGFCCQKVHFWVRRPRRASSGRLGFWYFYPQAGVWEPPSFSFLRSYERGVDGLAEDWRCEVKTFPDGARWVLGTCLPGPAGQGHGPEGPMQRGRHGCGGDGAGGLLPSLWAGGALRKHN